MGRKRQKISIERPASWVFGDKVWRAVPGWALAIRDVAISDEAGEDRRRADLVRLGVVTERLERACGRAGLAPTDPELTAALDAVLADLARQSNDLLEEESGRAERG